MSYEDTIPFPGTPRWNQQKMSAPLRMYRIITVDGTQDIQAHFMFNDDNGSGDILFRRYIDDKPSNRTNIVAQFAAGYWKQVMEIEDDKRDDQPE